MIGDPERIRSNQHSVREERRHAGNGWFRFIAVIIIFLTAAAFSFAQRRGEWRIPGQYIVVFEDDVKDREALIQSLVKDFGIKLRQLCIHQQFLC